MAIEAPARDTDDEDNTDVPQKNGTEDGKSEMASDGEEEDEEEEEGEPKLKYAPLTKNLSSLYRNGDATSSFLVGGDKMVGSQVRDGRVRDRKLKTTGCGHP